MKNLTLLTIPVLLCLLSAPAPAQTNRRPKYPAPPQSLNGGVPDQADPSAPSRKHVDILQLQREASELSKMAQTIPLDVESVRKGMLPKDVIQKLKQIEKLSKQLRSELNP